MMIEDARIIHQGAPETDICTIARRAEALVEKYLPAAARRVWQRGPANPLRDAPQLLQ